MKRQIVLFLLFIVAFTNLKAQYYTPIATPYTWSSGGRFPSALGIPSDTFAVPLSQKSFPHIAAKNGVLYVWSPSANKWVQSSGAEKHLANTDLTQTALSRNYDAGHGYLFFNNLNSYGTTTTYRKGQADAGYIIYHQDSTATGFEAGIEGTSVGKGAQTLVRYQKDIDKWFTGLAINWAGGDSSAGFDISEDYFRIAGYFPSGGLPSDRVLLYDSASRQVKTINYRDLSAGSGLSDGDKGDITVSSSGTNFKVDSGALSVKTIKATGTPSATTVLAGDSTWKTFAKYNFTALRDGDYLQYDSLNNEWINTAAPTGGGSFSGTADSIRVMTAFPSTGNVVIRSDLNGSLWFKTALYWKRVATDSSIELSATTYTTPVSFNSLSGAITESPTGTWNMVATGYMVDNSHSLPGAGGVQMDLTGVNDAVVLGLDDNNTLEYYYTSNIFNYRYNVYVYSGVVYAAISGQSASSPTNIGSTTGIVKLRMERDATGTVTVQKSTDGTNFTVLHTFSGTFTGTLYTKCGSLNANKLVNPKSAGFE